jgi:hypothetical protein
MLVVSPGDAVNRASLDASTFPFNRHPLFPSIRRIETSASIDLRIASHSRSASNSRFVVVQSAMVL